MTLTACKVSESDTGHPAICSYLAVQRSLIYPPSCFLDLWSHVLERPQERLVEVILKGRLGMICLLLFQWTYVHEDVHSYCTPWMVFHCSLNLWCFLWSIPTNKEMKNKPLPMISGFFHHFSPSHLFDFISSILKMWNSCNSDLHKGPKCAAFYEHLPFHIHHPQDPDVLLINLSWKSYLLLGAQSKFIH